MMNSLTDCYKLYNGVEIPCIGLGTWQTPEGDVCVNAVKTAIEAGYRHIDTAMGYANEEGVGAGVKASGFDRTKLFITSKLGNRVHGYDNAMQAFEVTMKKLDMDYLDLYLIHWPNPISYRGEHWFDVFYDTWRAFEDLYKAGRVRAIGLSNSRRHHVEELIAAADIAPMVNQIRLCPGDTQDEVVDYCRSQNMVLEAYSPMGTGKIFQVPEMQALSEKYGKTIAQICIRWSLQRGYLPMPKSVTPERIISNTQVFDFELEPADVQLIADLKGCVGYSDDPDTCPF